MVAEHPHIVWVYLDQCRADVLGCYGHPFVETPNIDRLARAGVVFENAYCQNPVCVPSRVSMMSGMYCHQTGVFNNGQKMRPQDSLLLGAFAEAGYRTANVGKVHLGISPAEAGFHEHRGIAHDGVPHFRAPDGYPPDLPWRAFDAPGFPQPIIYATDTCPRERTYSAVGVDQGIDIFRNHGDGVAPLLLRVSLDRPHTPVSSPPPYATMYAGRTALPTYGQHEKRTQPASLKDYIAARRWDLFTRDEILKIRYHYYGLVTHLDAELGRLFDAVERSVARGRTVLLLTADHGCMLGEHGLFVKGPHYHLETARVPFLVAWPGVLPAGVRVRGLVEMVDLLPTLCDMCGVTVPPRAAGMSLLPVVHGAHRGREDVFAEQIADRGGVHWSAVRTTTYCYTRYHTTGEAALYDLDADHAECRNLTAESPDPGVVAALDRRLAARAG